MASRVEGGWVPAESGRRRGPRRRARLRRAGSDSSSGIAVDGGALGASLVTPGDYECSRLLRLSARQKMEKFREMQRLVGVGGIEDV